MITKNDFLYVIHITAHNSVHKCSIALLFSKAVKSKGKRNSTLQRYSKEIGLEMKILDI